MKDYRQIQARLKAKREEATQAQQEDVKNVEGVRQEGVGWG